jgi:non-ribosomal peptide synthetase component F
VGSASSSRKHSATQLMWGLLLNTIVLRNRFTPETPFLELVKMVRESTLGALSNDDVPFSWLVNEFGQERRPGVSPLFQVMFSLEPPIAPLSDGWKFTQMDVETGIAKFDLHLEMDERDDGLLGRFIFSTDIFNTATIRRLTDLLFALLTAIINDPACAVGTLAGHLPALVVPPEQHQTNIFKKLKKFWAKDK